MNRPAVLRVAAASYAAVDLGVLMAPSLVLAFAAHKGGLPDWHGMDLVVASAMVGAVHAAIAFRRLVHEGRTAVRRSDVWIAAADALVVLALGATVLLIVVLGGFANEHAVLVNRGWAVVWLWVGVQVTAIALAEASGRFVFRWLERAVPDRPQPGNGGHSRRVGAYPLRPRSTES